MILYFHMSIGLHCNDCCKLALCCGSVCFKLKDRNRCFLMVRDKGKGRGKGSGVWPSMVTHTRNLSSAFNPSKCTLTAVNTHPEQWAAILRRPGSSGGSVPCSRVSPQSWYWRWREHLLFTPPTDNPCRTWESNLQPLGYKSNSLTIRPRLPPYSRCMCVRKYQIWF